jgi:hypothetical protein
MTKTKWAIYTVVLGLVPILSRLLIAALSKGPISPVEASDVVGFGFVLAITNISSLEHATNVDPGWKTQSIGISLIGVALLSIVFVASCLPAEQFDRSKTLWSACALSATALLHSYSVCHRLAKA